MAAFPHFHDTEKSMKNRRITAPALLKAKDGMQETVRQELLSLVKPARNVPV
jgi:hypothetical protein